MLKNLAARVLAGVLTLASASSLSCVTETETRASFIVPGFGIRLKWSDVNNGSGPKTLEEIAAYQKLCIRPAVEIGYKTRNGFITQFIDYEEWKSAKGTHELGYGDCDCRAISGAYFDEKLGGEPRILVFDSEPRVQTGHAVTLMQRGNKFGYLDGNYSGLRFHSSEEIADDVSINLIEANAIIHPWKRYVIIELNKDLPKECDWRQGEGNLHKYFQPVIERKLAEKYKNRPVR